jgi:ABC-type ATPase with predicted acetyltransferase domain
MKHPAQTGLSVVANAMTVEVPDTRDRREQKKILKDVNFRIEPGEFVCVLGPSGTSIQKPCRSSGRSTMQRRCDFLQMRPRRIDRPQSIGSSPTSGSTGCGTRRSETSPVAK